jgi:penicillin-binding protein 2
MHVFCAGGATFFGHFYACDRHHGMVDIEHAIPWSCDTFFYTLANKLGIDTIARYGKSVGLGERTGIDLPNEAAGIMPSEQWKLKNYHEKWFAGETISVGIGQGAVTATPIQLARMISGIASYGHFVRPHVVDPIANNLPAQFQQAIKDSFPGSGEATIPIDPATWMTITEGMAGATDPTMGGTAGASHLEGVDFAGKTGSAQVASHEAIKRLGGGKEFLPNGWFVGVIPRRNPEFVVAVLWEHGDWGSNAARLAAQVATVYVNKKRMQDHNALAQAGIPSDGSLSLGWKAGGMKPIEMGAVWTGSESGSEATGRNRKRGGNGQTAILRGGHFLVDAAPLAPARAVASTQHSLPAWLLALPLRIKQELP